MSNIATIDDVYELEVIGVTPDDEILETASGSVSLRYGVHYRPKYLYHTDGWLLSVYNANDRLLGYVSADMEDQSFTAVRLFNEPIAWTGFSSVISAVRAICSVMPVVF